MWIIPLRLLDGASAVGTVVPPPPLGLPDLSIGNFYVIDQRVKRRRPLTEMEFALVRQWAAIYKRVKLRYFKDMTANRELERKAEAQLRGERRKRAKKKPVVISRRADPSGLRPMKRREMRARV